MSLFDYEINRTQVTLHNVGYYETYFSIEGVQIILTVGYNGRNKKRWVSLRTVDGSILLQRTFLSGLDRAYPTINAEILGISFFVVLEPKDINLISDDYLNWADNYWLTFVSNVIEYDETYEQIKLDVFVGGR